MKNYLIEWDKNTNQYLLLEDNAVMCSSKSKNVLKRIQKLLAKDSNTDDDFQYTYSFDGVMWP